MAELKPVRLNSSAVARALGAVALLLVLASIGGQLTKYLLGHGHVHGLVRLFDVDREGNIPTLFSVLLLFFTALLLTVIALVKKNQKEPDVAKWTTLAVGFLYLTIDEGAILHERLITPVRALLGDRHLGVFYYAWVIPGIAILFVLVLFFLRFLLRLPAKTRLAFGVAGALYIGGALGVELLGGWYAELHGPENLTYSLIATVEESLEMAGLIVFVHALLKYIADNYREIEFLFDGPEGDGPSGIPEDQPGAVRGPARASASGDTLP